MRGVDTNIVIRLLVADDPAQFRQARFLFETERCFIPKTVLLEADWVLRARYGRKPAEALAALALLVDLENVVVEDAANVRRALQWAGRGLQFADALHLAAMPDGVNFVSFDRDLIVAATDLQRAPVVELPA